MCGGQPGKGNDASAPLDDAIGSVGVDESGIESGICMESEFGTESGIESSIESIIASGICIESSIESGICIESGCNESGSTDIEPGIEYGGIEFGGGIGGRGSSISKSGDESGFGDGSSIAESGDGEASGTWDWDAIHSIKGVIIRPKGCNIESGM